MAKENLEIWICYAACRATSGRRPPCHGPASDAEKLAVHDTNINNYLYKSSTCCNLCNKIQGPAALKTADFGALALQRSLEYFVARGVAPGFVCCHTGATPKRRFVHSENDWRGVLFQPSHVAKVFEFGF